MDRRDLAEKGLPVGLHRLAMTDAKQVCNLAEDLRDETIDLLVNNAGVYLHLDFSVSTGSGIRRRGTP